MNYSENINILIVDDSKFNRNIILGALNDNKDDNWSFQEACDGIEVIEILAKKDIDLIILDIQMEKMNGFEVLDYMKSREKFKHIPVIILSSHSQKEYIQKGLKMGAIDFIQKPIPELDLEFRLCGMVRNLIELKKAKDREKNLLNDLKDVNKQLQESYKILENEIIVAQTIQCSTLPFKKIYDKKFELSYKFEFYEKIGGDTFDVIKIDKDRYLIYIADIVGHGIPAALLSTNIRSLIYTFNFGKKETSAKLLEYLNNYFLNNFKNVNDSDGPLITVTMMPLILDFKKKSITFSSASHPPLFLYRDGDMIIKNAEGFMLGIFDDYKYKEVKLDMKKDDMIYLYTDGMFESKKFKEFEFNLFNKIVRKFSTISDDINENVEKIFEFIKKEFYKNEFEDDTTFIGIKIL